MKTLKEIETKIGEVDYAIDKEVERGELKPSTTRGWLVGLGMAKALYTRDILREGKLIEDCMPEHQKVAKEEQWESLSMM